jgi:hypothetical protein
MHPGSAIRPMSVPPDPEYRIPDPPHWIRDDEAGAKSLNDGRLLA